MKQVASATEIQNTITNMTRDILADHGNQSPLFVALLRGAAPFASKLMFEITRQAPDYHPEIDYMMISTYGSGRLAGEPEIVTDLAPTTSIEGRIIIVLDDVLDKGVTAQFVTSYLRTKGAAEVKLAVLVDKQTNRTYDISPSYTCLVAGDAWLAGMGMDDAATGLEAYRWRDSIYQVK